MSTLARWQLAPEPVLMRWKHKEPVLSRGVTPKLSIGYWSVKKGQERNLAAATEDPR